MHLGVCRHIPRARKNRRNPKNPLGQSHMSRLGPTPAAMSVEYSCLRGYFSTTGPISTWFSPRIQIPSRFVEVSHHYSRISIPCRLLRTWTGMCAVCSGMCTRACSRVALGSGMARHESRGHRRDTAENEEGELHLASFSSRRRKRTSSWLAAKLGCSHAKRMGCCSLPVWPAPS